MTSAMAPRRRSSVRRVALEAQPRVRCLFCELTTSRGYERVHQLEHPRSHADIFGTELPAGLQGW
jgi:hypothetical protein